MDEEAWLSQVMHPIKDDPFHDLAIFELKLHPHSMHHRGIGEELQIIPVALAFKALDEEDGLHFRDRYLLNGIVIRTAQLEDVRNSPDSLEEQAFQFLPFLGFDVALDDAALGVDDNLVELDFFAHSGPGYADGVSCGGWIPYCLIL